jgi:hypothetical protein
MNDALGTGNNQIGIPTQSTNGDDSRGEESAPLHTQMQ